MPDLTKQDILKHASNEEEALLLARAFDARRFYEQTGKPRFLGFLSPRAADIMRQAFGGDHALTFFGGYDEAERVVAAFGEARAEFPIRLLKIEGAEDGLTHRDFLGSLMALGISRDVLGDIVLDGGYGYVFVLSSMADYLSRELDRVGRCRVRCTVLSSGEVTLHRAFDVGKESVASLRGDAVIGAVFHLSRSDAADRIRRGEVTVNYEPLLDADKKINVGDVFSLRGSGKAQIESVGQPNKKNRVMIEVKRYK